MAETKTVSHQWAAAEEMELSLSVVFCVNWGSTVHLLVQGSLLEEKKKKDFLLHCYRVVLLYTVHIQTQHKVNGHVADSP